MKTILIALALCYVAYGAIKKHRASIGINFSHDDTGISAASKAGLLE